MLEYKGWLLVASLCRLLTLTYRAHDIGLKLRVLLEHCCKTLASEFGCSLSTMTVKDGKAAVITRALKVVLHHKLLSQSKNKQVRLYCKYYTTTLVLTTQIVGKRNKENVDTHASLCRFKKRD